MHSAPAIRYPVARAWRVALAIAALWGLGVLVCAWWSLQPGVAPGAFRWVWACVAASGLAAVVQWRRLPQGCLHWDGAQWSWEGAGTPLRVAVDLRLDAAELLLVRLSGLRGQPAAAAPWAILERQHLPDRWLDLRRALVAS